MSVGVLLEAAGTVLRSAISKDRHWVDVSLDGAPPASAGEWFVGIHDLGTSPIAGQTEMLGEEFRFAAVVSYRLSRIPRDRRGGALLQFTPAVDTIQRQIMAALHGWAVITEANTAGGFGDETTGSEFFGGLFFDGASATDIRGGEWSAGAPDAEAWAVRSVYFRGAQRLHSTQLIL